MNKHKEKLLKKEMDCTPTRHHIINKFSKDLFENLNDPKNIVVLPRRPHKEHHVSQKNNAPHETLFFYGFFMQVTSEKAKEHLQALLNMSIEEFYDERFVKRV